jgi:hypothetical protein
MVVILWAKVVGHCEQVVNSDYRQSPVGQAKASFCTKMEDPAKPIQNVPPIGLG